MIRPQTIAVVVVSDYISSDVSSDVSNDVSTDVSGFASDDVSAAVPDSVSNDETGGASHWTALRRTLRAWADQDGPPADEFVLVVSTHGHGSIPGDLATLVPNLSILSVVANSSYELKNRAAEHAKSDWLAIVDADCVPQQTWLEVLRRALDDNPSASAISAKTLYPGRSRVERILGLLSRSYLDPGHRGGTRFISGNAACVRRDLFCRHPLPVGKGAFASRMQSEALLREGAFFFFEPELVVVHDFEGWPMERDIRRNHGYCTVITRLHDDRLPYAGLIRVGALAIPFIVAGKALDSLRDCMRCFRHYNVKAYELPLAMCLVAVTHLLEVPGMWAAYRGRTVGPTAYR